MYRWMVRELATALAVVVLVTQVLTAQTVNTPQGWPVVEPTPAAAPEKPATQPKEELPAKKPKPRPAPPAVVIKAPPSVLITPAPVTASAPVPEVVAEAVPMVLPAAPPLVVTRPNDTDLVAALKEQSQLLSRLAAELDAERARVAEQGRQLAALEKKAAAAAAPAPPPSPPPAITVDTGGARLRLAGLLQGWFVASDAGVADTFRLRRGEVKLGGELNRRVRWDLVLDAAKALSVSNSYVTVNGQRVMSDTSVGQSGRMLQDAFLTITKSGAFAVAVGQQKLPLAMEGVQSSSRLETVERALFMSDKSRGGTYGDIRDFGVVAKGKVAQGQLEYAAGVFNGFGETQNDIDRDGQKPFMGRVVARPSAMKGFAFGSSYGRTTAHAGVPTRRDRAGVDASFTRGRVFVASELMTGHDGVLERQGYYAHTTYRVFRDIDAVFRADMFDPDTTADTSAANVTERDWLGGMNWRIAGPSAVLQMNYLRKTFLDVQPARHVFMANVQTAW